MRTEIGIPGAPHAQPARARPGHARGGADHIELRIAVAAVLAHADAWRDADPDRHFAPALHALARAQCQHQPGLADPGGASTPGHPHPAPPDPLPGSRHHREPSSPPPGPRSPTCPHLSKRRLRQGVLCGLSSWRRCAQPELGGAAWSLPGLSARRAQFVVRWICAGCIIGGLVADGTVLTGLGDHALDGFGRAGGLSVSSIKVRAP